MVMQELEECSHVFVAGICGNCGCGQHIDTICASKLGYIHKDHTVSTEDRDRLREFRLTNMMQKKKLYLILDLDHTLVHSVRPSQLSLDEMHLLNEANSLQDISSGSSLCRFDTIQMITKLRPFVRIFLEKVSDMYEMYIYTRGGLAYALKVAKLLDPGRKYFGSRVISRDDCTQKHGKNLDMVLAAENAVVILDDSGFAWPKNKQNLMLIQKYFYFAYGNMGVSPSASIKKESESDTALLVSLKVLERMHQMFFAGDVDADFKGRDVRQVMKRARTEVFFSETRERKKRIQAEEFIPL
ncbi:hypothetical protein AQUCO_01800046v1 [Aquilegia coerulea]|uniref:RNA polymerase II C-terminal domain phosphatase-like n=1 Tax=Aquilegia coerulea TaxID=218851 RepID=A0A2G5DJM6_AQUCA|nr:hypothetical protein AQUCO_01800046v1 [Aquilegia coerulea]